MLRTIRVVLVFLLTYSLVSPMAAYAQEQGLGLFPEDEEADLPALPSQPQAPSSPPAVTETGEVSVSVKLDDKPVTGAYVKLTCYGYSGSQNELTDAIGTVRFQHVPVGQCQLAVNYQQNSDSKLINVVKGMSSEEFNFKTSTESSSIWIKILGGIGLAIVLVFGLLISYKLIRRAIRRRKKTKQTKLIEPKEELSDRVKDLLKTLDDKEKQVVKFLLQNEGACSQAKIYYGTGIKRTTLHRVIDSLARKKILEVEKRAKARYVKLTEWFLNG